MAKSKVPVPSVFELQKEIKSKKFPSVICLAGVDSFGIDTTLKLIEKYSSSFLASEFDKEVYYGSEKNLDEVLSAASSFPFGDGKKLIIYKEFEKIKDKKKLTAYVKSPSETTVLVLIHNGDPTSYETDPFKSLNLNNYLFQSKELKGAALVDWLTSLAQDKGKRFPRENVQYMIDTVGEDRTMLEMQLDKILTYTGENQEITFEAVKSLAANTKEYSIFDLQNAIGKRDKQNAFKILNNMLDKGSEPIMIIAMLTKYFAGLSQVRELDELKLPLPAIAGIIGTHPYYYKDYQSAAKIYNDLKLRKAAKVLLETDVKLKSTSTDEKTLLTVMLANIMD